MTCAACSARVQRALDHEPGVESANVNLLTSTATVTYRSRRHRAGAAARGDSQHRLRRRAARARHDAGGPRAGASTASARPRLRSLGRKVMVAGCAAAATMALMPVAHGHGASLWRWVLLGLTLPSVLWAGRHFYTRAWQAARHGGATMNTLIAVGTGAAFLFSLAMTIAGGWFAGHGVEPVVYYEAVNGIIALILLGNYLEARARRRTSRRHPASDRAPARHGASAARWRRDRRFRSPRWPRATWWWCGRVSGSPPTGS